MCGRPLRAPPTRPRSPGRVAAPGLHGRLSVASSRHISLVAPRCGAERSSRRWRLRTVAAATLAAVDGGGSATAAAATARLRLRLLRRGLLRTWRLRRCLMGCEYLDCCPRQGEWRKRGDARGSTGPRTLDASKPPTRATVAASTSALRTVLRLVLLRLRGGGFDASAFDGGGFRLAAACLRGRPANGASRWMRRRWLLQWYME